MFSRPTGENGLPERDRQTDGRTDRITLSISRVSSAVLTRDKNGKIRTGSLRLRSRLEGEFKYPTSSTRIVLLIKRRRSSIEFESRNH